jgi:hypothetical protein
MAILLTYTSKEWPYSELIRMEAMFFKQGYVDEPWGARKEAVTGEHAWLLRQGGEGHVIFGEGSLVTHPAKAPDRNGKRRYMATIRFHRFIDPRRGSLIDQDNTREILGRLIGARSSGQVLPDEIDALLAKSVGK